MNKKNIPIEKSRKNDKMPPVDRNKENNNVAEYQRTGNINILTEIYKNRIPTLNYLAKKYYYLGDSKDDLYGDLSLKLLKAIDGYKIGKGSFNTFFYSSCLYYIRNLHTGKLAKKRTPIDPKHNNNFILSLDYNYCQDGEENNLKNKISDESLLHHHNITEPLHIEDTLSILSGSNICLKSFLRKIAHGETIASGLKYLKIKNGSIKIDKHQTRLCNKKQVSKYIRSYIVKDNFSLINYKITGDQLSYTIEMNKTAETNMLIRAIKKIKKNKKLLEKIQ